VIPRAGLNDEEKENYSLYREWNSEPSVVQLIASRYTDYAIPAPSKISFIISQSKKKF
jgi:hypothetical protein